MHISSLIVKDYRSIDYICLKFSPGKNVIVGKNNAGKSNIIRALNLILGDKNPTYNEVTPNDFHSHDGDSTNSFWVLCTLKGADIDEETFLSIKGQWKGKLQEEPFINNRDTNEVELNVDHVLFNTDEYFNSREDKQWIKGRANLLPFKDELNNADRICLLFYSSKGESDEEEYIKEFRVFYQSAARQPWYCLWNVSPKLRESLLTCAILPAFREPASQLRINNYSWYGKLLKKAWESRRNDPYGEGLENVISLHDKLHEAYEQVNQVGSLVFGNLSSDIKRRLDVAFKDIELAFHFFVSKGDVHKQTQIFVNDGFDSLLIDKGSGIQSAIIIGLFSYYCSLFHCNTTLLAIEEPELYLHPQARRVISHRLSEFVNMHSENTDGATKQNQVVITTHSSEFIRAGEIDSISVIRKVYGKTLAYNYPIDARDKKTIQALLKSENSEMFFADKVIICEGGEKHILPHLADYFSGNANTLDENNISIVRANGKGDIIKYINILKACNIQYYVLADLDYLFEGLNQELDESIPSLREEAKAIIEREDDLFRANKDLRKVLKPDASFNAKEFCRRMELLKTGNCEPSYVLEAYEFIEPKVKNKVNKQLLDDPDNETFKTHLSECLMRIWESYDIYILNNGELEDYLTPTALGLPGSKDTKLLEIIDRISPEDELTNYLYLDEFKVFLSRIIEVRESSDEALIDEFVTINGESDGDLDLPY